jgi:hypothetical protein
VKEKFRIVVPEIATIPCGFAFDRTISTRIETVLWSGESLPDERIYEAITEGQVYNRSHSSKEQSQHPAFIPIGNELLIQKRHRFRVIGWITINSIQIPQ